MPPASEPPAGRHEKVTRACALATLIREQRAQILEDWEREVRAAALPADLPRPALVDHVPDLLDGFAEMVEAWSAGREPPVPRETAERHALERLEQGFHPSQLVRELSLLRDAILQRCNTQGDAAFGGEELRGLNRAIDRTMCEAVARYVEARDRTLESLDRLSAAALESRALEEFLPRLLKVLIEAAPIVDTATILLREGDRLVARASVGLEAEVEAGYALKLGEGFAGRIGETKQPLLVRAGALDALVLSPTVRARGLTALYGLPLTADDELIGVVHMGSLTAHDFSDAEKHLLAALAGRATAVIRLRRSEERFRWLVSATAAAVWTALPDGTFEHSPSWSDFTGQASAELRAQGWLDVVHPEDVPRTREAWAQALATGSTYEAEYRVRARGGGYRWTVSRAVPVRDASGAIREWVGMNVDITDRKRMEEDLAERELRFRTLADNIPQLAWMADAQGSRVWYNRRWLEFTGCSLEQMLGDGWQQVHHPDHVARVVAKFRRHIERGQAWEDTFPLRAQDGQYRWFLSRAVPMRDAHGKVQGWFGTNTDVSEQRLLSEASRRLSQSLDLDTTFQTIAQLAVPPLGDFCFIDLLEEGALRRVAWAHKDREIEQRLSPTVSASVPPLSASANAMVRVVTSGEPLLLPEVSDAVVERWALSDEHRALLEALRPRSVLAVPISRHGQILGAFMLAFTQGSSRRHTAAEQELALELAGRAAIALENARLFREARDAVRLREEILAVVSHDLRDPLSAIGMATAMLVQKPGNTPKYAETIRRAAARMNRLIGDLLDLAGIQAGRLAIEQRPEDAGALLEEVASSYEAAAREKGIELRRRYGALSGRTLSCDRERAEQVLGNLLGNALKFCEAGDTITLQAEVIGNEARFAVADTGPGIPEADLAHVFKPYWSAKSQERKGTGLGLYISKGLVEAHGGRLWLESKQGVGTTFYFTLPLADAARLKSGIPEPSSPSDALARPSWRRQR